MNNMARGQSSFFVVFIVLNRNGVCDLLPKLSSFFLPLLC